MRKSVLRSIFFKNLDIIKVRYSLFLGILIITGLISLSSFAISSTVVLQSNRTGDILKILALEEEEFQIIGKVKEVVMGLRGNGYILLVNDQEEVRIPLSFANPTNVKVGTQVTVSGKTKTFLIPVYLESAGYKVHLRRAKISAEDVEMTTLSCKITKIEVSKMGAYIFITDGSGTEYKIPAQFIPVWKNLQVGDDFKIIGIQRTVNIPESITIEGKTYKLSSPSQVLNKFQLYKSLSTIKNMPFLKAARKFVERRWK